MASRFSLVNRGYEVEKVGPSTTNRYLLPPRRVGEITPTTNLRDEKNAKGPLAKVKLTPQVQTGDDTGIKSTSVNTDPSYMTATQLSQSMSQSRTAKSLTSFFDPTTTTGLIAAGVVPGGGVAAGINVSSTKQISAVQAEAQNRLRGIDKAQRTKEELTKDKELETLVQISLGAARKARTEDVLAYEHKLEKRETQKRKRDKLIEFVTIDGRRKVGIDISGKSKEDLRKSKQQAQARQLQKTYSDVYGIGGGFQEESGSVTWT
jgi:hypothetical protein